MQKYQFFTLWATLLLVFTTNSVHAQMAEHVALIDTFDLFAEESVLKVELTLDMKRLVRQKHKKEEQEAKITYWPAEGVEFTYNIQVSPRGNFRRKYCFLPPLKLNFKKTPKSKAPSLHQLNKIKLVTDCKSSKAFQQYLITEYLCYRMFNILADKSFKVRLLELTYIDSEGKKEPMTRYGFLIEDIDDLADRNDCKEVDDVKITQRTCDRQQTMMVGIFQYMIGNTDWSIPHMHNIKLIRSNDPFNQTPYIVPYDFDYSGLVNTHYAIPNPDLGIKTVRNRLYRGVCCSSDELETILARYRVHKDDLYALCQEFPLLEESTRNNIIEYLDDFYSVINNPKLASREFQATCMK